uniref:solute carrier family 43 member 3-like n=1 Tax=Ciona intestinalis TaxID=7719 RepID=UPI000180AFEA|nr:solute carrier family 43 member 3-like [Ciona intestinalis]|eukprot:XP_002125124.1 solute carrier family 43 member 3-like [Ciona intestinalis]
MERKQVLSVIAAVFDTLLFGGIIFGWPSLDFVLKREGYFSSKCEIETADLKNDTAVASSEKILNCPSQDIALSLVYTLSSTLGGISSFPLGYLFDRFGTWKFRSCGILISILACVAVACSNKQSSLVLYIAMPILAVGGFTIIISNAPIGYFCVAAQATVISIIYGAFDSSAAVMVVMKSAYELGATVPEIFTVYGALLLLSLVYTFVLMPRMHVSFNVPDGYQYGLTECFFSNNTISTPPNGIQNKTENNGSGNSESISILTNDINKQKTFSSSLKDISYWLNVTYISILQLRLYFFFATFNQWLSKLTSNHPEQRKYVAAFGYIQLTGVLLGPFGGLLTDMMIKYFRKSSTFSEQAVRKRAISITIGCTCLMATIFSVLVLIPVLEIQYITFVIQNIARTFLFSGNGVFIATTFPSEHFGKLQGISLGIASMVSLLNYPINILVVKVFGGNFMVVDLVFLGLCVLTFVNPVVLFLRSKKSI